MQTFARVAHPFPGCLRKHLMKSTIISVICTNMRKFCGLRYKLSQKKQGESVR